MSRNRALVRRSFPWRSRKRDVRREFGENRESLTFQQLERRVLLAGMPQLIDVNPGSGSSNPKNFTEVNNSVFFTSGQTIWKTDGTQAGTVSLKVTTSLTTELENVNGTLFFAGPTGLWKSDGTQQGSIALKTSGVFNVHSLTNVNGTLFFISPNPTNGRELWKSDGTNTGTVFVKSLVIGSQESDYENASISNVNGTLIFQTHVNNKGVIGKSDGTSSGTSVLTSSNEWGGNWKESANGSYFASDWDVEPGERGLWISNGTVTGTKKISNGFGSPHALSNINGTLFFTSVNLWRSDGTVQGTTLVKSVGSTHIYNIANVNGTLFFSGNDGSNGSELWKSDGTPEGTGMVKDIALGLRDGFRDSGRNYFMCNVNGTLYFSGNEFTHGRELWKSDGTEAGTVLVSDIRPGTASGFPKYLTNINGKLFFQASDGTNGTELWILDGGGESPVKGPGVRGPYTAGPGVVGLGVPGAGVAGVGIPGVGVRVRLCHLT